MAFQARNGRFIAYAPVTGVGEVTAQGAAGSLHHHTSVLDVDLHYRVNWGKQKTHLLRGFQHGWKQE